MRLPSLTRAPACTKAEGSERVGCGRPGLLLSVGDPTERQSVGEFPAGDDAEALVAAVDIVAGVGRA